jgi:hypothetical protein
VISFEIPIETKSANNLREHWSARHKRIKDQRAATSYRTPREVKQLGPLLLVMLTRRAPRELDSDNLQGALKGVRDQIAAALGVDDRTSLVRWSYAQEKGEPAVLVSVEVLK